MNKILLAILVAISFSVFLGFQEAFAVSFFTDRPSWEAAMGAVTITTDPFDNPIANADVIVFDSGVVSTGLNGGGTNDVNEVRSAGGGLYAGNVDKDSVVSYETIRWDFPNPIIGFGGDFVFACNGEILLIISNFEGGGDVTISIADHLSPPCSDFFGIVSTSSFQSVRYTSGTGSALNEFWFMDNLSFNTQRGVGGEIIPIDTTALLLAGAQMNATWMIPVIVVAIGFAIVIARKI